MFKINSGDQQAVVSDVVSDTVGFLGSFRSKTDSAYINILAKNDVNDYDVPGSGYALGTSNLSSTEAVFSIGSYSCNIATNTASMNSSLYIKNNSVGIFNTNPTYTLDVKGTINSSNSYLLNGTTIVDSSRNLTNINNATIGGLITTSNITVLGTLTLVNQNTTASSNLLLNNTDGNNIALVVNHTASADYIAKFNGTAGATTLVVDKSGRVGINTSDTSSDALHVNGTINASNYKIMNQVFLDSTRNLTNINNATINGTLTASNLTVLGTTTIINSLTTENSNLIINNFAGNNAAVVVNQTSTTANVIADFKNATATPVLRINKANNVGINTTATTSTLNVGGDVNATSYKLADQVLFDSSRNAFVNQLKASSNLTVSSNLQVFGPSEFKNSIYVSGDTFVSGTVYAQKVRLGTAYSTTTVNGTLAASLSIPTQLSITQLNTVTVQDLTIGKFRFYSSNVNGIDVLNISSTTTGNIVSQISA